MDKKGVEDRFSTSHSLEVIDSPRKRLKLDSSVRKSWSLTDRRTDQEVLQEMGVSLLEPDDHELDASASLIKQSLKRKHDIENVNPNANSITSPKTRHSPRSPKVACSPSPGTSKGRSPRSLDKVKPLQPTDNILETITVSDYQIDEETPLAQSVSAQYMRHDAGSLPCEATTTSERKKRNSFTEFDQEYISCRCKSPIDGGDCFSTLSDEVILSVFKWLPKRTIAHCMLVCKRWLRVASDETLWQRLDLGNKTLAKDALGKILDRKPIIVRLASSEIGEWHPPCPQPSRLQYLDLSMSNIDEETLVSLLLSCPMLSKLSLENIPVSSEAGRAVGKCVNLETLNLTMVQGLTAEGVTAIVDGCTRLVSLNISWCNLDEAALDVLVERLPEGLQRLNLGGARLLTDDNVWSLCRRCRWLVELDVSDCSRLQEPALGALLTMRRLDHLALTRCYNLQPHALTKLSGMAALQYLEVWGMLHAAALQALRAALPGVTLNQFMFSAIARPTVGTRRTSIWGLRTRD